MFIRKAPSLVGESAVVTYLKVVHTSIMPCSLNHYFLAVDYIDSSPGRFAVY